MESMLEADWTDGIRDLLTYFVDDQEEVVVITFGSWVLGGHPSPRELMRLVGIEIDHEAARA